MELIDRFRGLARRFAADRSANVLVMSALSIPVVIGVAGLATEYGLALAERSENQRVADLAAFAGATAYGKKSSEADMEAAAKRVGELNGIAPAHMKVAMVPSPSDASIMAVQVLVATERPLFLSQVISKKASVGVGARAYALLGSEEGGSGACILALDPSASGLTLSGGTKIEAPDCVVSSNAAVAVPCGTTLTSLELAYGSAAAPVQPCSGIKGPKGGTPSIVNRQTADPFDGNPKVAAAAARLKVAEKVQYPPAPSGQGGPDIDFGWDQNATKSKATSAGCTATWSQPKWTLSCGSKKDIKFGKLTMGGGIQLDFALDAPSGTIVTFAGPVTVAGSSTRFGNGNYRFAQGLHVSGTASFGKGSFSFGSHSCGYSLCNMGGASLSFDGPSAFSFSHGFKTEGGSTLYLGDDTGNSYRFGPGSDGYALRVMGGAKAYLADATGANGLFEIKGGIRTEGGSCISVPAAANHDVDGPLSFSGGVVLGAGLYAIDGYFALGENGGGNVNCLGRDVSLEAEAVTLSVSGSQTPKSGSCKGDAFCVAAGYRNVKLVAPKEGPTAGFAVVGPQPASIAAGASFVEGGSGARLSGVLYFPKGPVTLKGGASLLGKADGSTCLQMVGKKIDLSGGTAAASECKEAGGGGPSGGSVSVRLVQ